MRFTGLDAENFKSKAAYQKWLAYGHMHGEFKTPGNQQVEIRGEHHKVNHDGAALHGVNAICRNTDVK